MIVTKLLQRHLAQLESNFFGSQIYSIFQNDLKLNEVLAMGCLALNPHHFSITPLPQPAFNEVKDQKNEPSKQSSTQSSTTSTVKNSPIKQSDDGSKKVTPSAKKKNILLPESIDPERLQPLHLINKPLLPNIKCLTNEEFEQFAGEVMSEGVASPLNNAYPGIDGIAHFKYKTSLPDAKPEFIHITAITQVTISKTHFFGPEAAANLRSLIENIKAGVAKNKLEGKHRNVIFWVGRNLGSKEVPVCPDMNLEHYYVCKGVDKLTKAQKAELTGC